ARLPEAGPSLSRAGSTRVQSDSVPRRLVRVPGAAFAGRAFGGSACDCGLVTQDLADVAEQILGGRRNCFLGSSALAQLIELVHREDDDEVDGGGDDEEVDGRGDDRTQIERRLFDVLLDLEGQWRTAGTA